MDREQIKALGEHLAVKEYQLKPFWKMSGDISARLESDEAILSVQYIGSAGLTVITTTLQQDTLEEMLSDLIDGEFRLEVFEQVETDDDNPFLGLLDWRID
jgi:hypothetical protein